MPELRWLGASAFRLTLGDAFEIYIDPWLENADCPAAESAPRRVDLVILSHGHFDHVGQTMRLWHDFHPPIVAPQDLRRWLERQGLERDDRLGPDMGGTVGVGEVS